MALKTAAAPVATRTPPGRARTVIVGAGFAGMGMAIKLTESGDTDFVLLDKGNDVGGTWRDNTYPGAACDVPSRLYSFSFAQNATWSRSFSNQGEIQTYLEGVAEQYRVREQLYAGTELTEAVWKEQSNTWELTTSAGTITCDILVLATGALSSPKLPEVEGIETFTGEIFHTAQWDHDHDLAGERVAVIGTGASAIQVVPAIAPIVGHLTLFQRTPPWLLPRPDRPYGAQEQALHTRFPALTHAVRSLIYYSHEMFTIGLVRQPRLLKVAEKRALGQLKKQVPDETLRAKLTPSYVIGCKRVLLSSDYLPALTRSNVTVLTTGLAKVEGNTLIGQDGSHTEVDTMILATGFSATDPPIAHHVRGRTGATLAESFASDGMRALRGLAFPGFPNMFMLVGPNTGVGHTSMVQIIEAQVAYVHDAMNVMAEHGIDRLDPTAAALDSWNSDIQRRMQGSVWQKGGCASWYQDAHGRNTTLWPGSTIRFRHQLAKVDLREYDVTARPASVSA